MIRNYEVSVWTLQDSFITVLKPDKLESKGQIENAKMHLVNDGTAELSFTIPMYLGHTENTYWYDETNEAAPTRENPLWQNTVNGVILAGMRKIKVIFNKQTEDEAVFEFVITKVTERHEKDEKWCDVECEGLAFHELGKNGYKLSLTEDTYYNDHRDWENTEYTESEEAAHMAAEPRNNIEYWLHKIFDGTDWNWSVQMDYSNHDGIVYRLDLTNSAIDHAWVDLSNIADEEYHDTKLLTYFDLTKEQQAVVNQRRENMGLWRCDKIYEEEYVTEWDDDSRTESVNFDSSNYITNASIGPLTDVKINIKQVQEEGASSPNNNRPISGWTKVNIYADSTHTTTVPTKTIEFSEPVYGGTLDVTGGTLTITQCVDVFDGSEEWKYAGMAGSRPYYSTATTNYYLNVNKGTNGVSANWLPVIDDAQDQTYALSSVRLRSSSAAQNIVFFIVGSDLPNITSESELKAYLKEHPLQVSYPIMTPKTQTINPTSITPPTSNSYIWSDAGDISVIYQTQPTNIFPGAVEKAKEKERLINCEESNIYNITQDLAEVFGVFCKYKYYYDDNYHITGREVIFYNTFIQDSTGVIDITYPYDTGKITREMDSADVATKLYVKKLENSNTASGWATITDTAINKTLEDYILNFDYLYTIGTITEEQYAEIPKFETDVRKLNLEMLPKEQELDLLQLKLPEAEAAVTVLNNAVALDQERISANDDLLNNLTNGTQILHVTANRPNLSYLVPDKDVKEGEQPYKIILREKGIIKDTVHVYKTWKLAGATTTENTEGTENVESTDCAATETETTTTEAETTGNESTPANTEEEIGRYTLTEEVTYSPRFDADGNLIALANLAKSDDESSLRYITYDYRPALYYDNIKESWVRRLNDDEANRVKAQAELETIQNRIEVLKAELEALMIQKDNLLKYFNRLMGPALREANWQPEDEYGKFGAKYNTKLSFGDFNKDTLIQLYWDDVGFEDEQKNTYVIGAAEQVTRHYPCVELTQEFIQNFHNGGYTKLSDICFIFTDVNAEQISGSVTNPENTTTSTVDELKYYRYYAIGSQSQLAFVRSKLTGAIKPVLMLTGIETVNIYDGSEEEEVIIKQPTQEQLETFLSHNAQIGHIVPVYNAETAQFQYSIDTVQSFNGFLDTEEYDTIVFPRIRVNSLNLKTNSDELNVALPPSGTKSNIPLSEYVDYYVTPRENEYYITLRPDVFYMKAQKLPDSNFSINLNCMIADAASGIYLDALQIARENAYPKVEYTVDISMAKPDFMRVAYSTMNKIVHINDNELKFNHVQGYISDLDLDLDHPWQDKLGIKNYKTKFEDLFVDIVAQTEAMKKNSQIAEIGGQIFAPTGMLTKESLQEAFDGYNLQYEFNNGKLMIDDKNGILAASDEGVVAYRGGGIFTATEQDDDGNWVWNTGILPSGINADLIKTGRLDTNLINIYAGDNLKLQMNGTGLYAFKSWSDMVDFANKDTAENILKNLDEPPSDAALSYVVFNEEGLFLTMNDGAPYIDKDGTVQTLDLKALETPVDKVNRVEISWRGLILRNNANEEVFYADPDTGNLTIAGEIQATSGQIGPWMVGSRSLYQTLDTKIKGDQEQEVVPFATKNTIYLGEKGLSISDLFQLKTEVVQSDVMDSPEKEVKRILSDFSINEYLLDPNNKEKTILSPIFQIKNTQTSADPAYQVIINSNVQFGNNFILPIKNGGTGSNDGTGLYYKVDSQDNLPSNAKDGDLGVVLNTSNEIRYSDDPFTAQQPSGNYYGPFDFNTGTSSFTKNHKNGTYCGVSALCWNTHLTTNEVNAGYSMPKGNNYARLGWINNNDDKFNSAIWLPFDCPGQIDKNTILRINFKVKNRFWGSWNATGTANGIHQINTTSVDNNYGIKIIGSDWQTVVASGTFNIRRGSDDEGVYDDSPYTVQERTCICQLNNNLSGNCVLLFYSDAGLNSNSLTYLDCSEIKIYKALPNLNMPQLFLYSKRDSKWMQLAFALTSEP